MADFNSRLNKEGLQTFLTDVDNTYTTMAKRCEVIAKESQQDTKSYVQLEPLEDGQDKVLLNVPDQNDERFEIYNNLPEKFRLALETTKISDINEALRHFDEGEAEKYLQVCSEYGFIALYLWS